MARSTRLKPAGLLAAVNCPIFASATAVTGNRAGIHFSEADVVSRAGDLEAWPDLPYEVWRETCATLQLWTQIVGKIRQSLTPWLNHSWHVTLYVTARAYDLADSFRRTHFSNRLRFHRTFASCRGERRSAAANTPPGAAGRGCLCGCDGCFVRPWNKGENQRAAQ